MPTRADWKKWVAVVSIAGVLFTIFGGVLGAGVSVVNDRAEIVNRIANTENALTQHKTDNTETTASVSRRLDVNDARWQAMEQRLARIEQDVAVMKAILERVERDLRSPAKNPLDGQPKQDK